MLLTVADTAERLGCSTSTVHRLIASGRLVAHKYRERNSHVRVDEESVTKLLAASRVNADAYAVD